MKCLLLRGLVGAERHVDGHQRLPRAPHHGTSLQYHHFEGYWHGCLEAVYYIAQRIADQDYIAVCVEQRGCMRAIGGEHYDRLTVLARADLRCRLAPSRIMHRHRSPSKINRPLRPYADAPI